MLAFYQYSFLYFYKRIAIIFLNQHSKTWPERAYRESCINIFYDANLLVFLFISSLCANM